MFLKIVAIVSGVVVGLATISQSLPAHSSTPPAPPSTEYRASGR